MVPCRAGHASWYAEAIEIGASLICADHERRDSALPGRPLGGPAGDGRRTWSHS